MKKSSSEDLLVGAARGEPMGVEEREQLDAALTSCGRLRSRHRAQLMLSADLACLRAALAECGASPCQENALRAAFRAHQAARARPPVSSRARRVAAVAALAASVAALVAGSFLGADGLRGGATAPGHVVPVAADRPPDVILPDLRARMAGLQRRAVVEPLASTRVFQPLMYAPPPSPAGAYSIVRVRIPLSSLAMYVGAEVEGTVEADILLGEDGLASGIRFIEAEALIAAAAEPAAGDGR